MLKDLAYPLFDMVLLSREARYRYKKDRGTNTTPKEIASKIGTPFLQVPLKASRDVAASILEFAYLNSII